MSKRESRELKLKQHKLSINPLYFAVIGFTISLLALADSLCLFFVLVLQDWTFWQLVLAFFILAGTILLWLCPLFLQRKNKLVSSRQALLVSTFSLSPLLLTPVVAFVPPFPRIYFGIWGGAAVLCVLLRLWFVLNRNVLRLSRLATSKWAPHFLVFAAALLFFLSPQLRFLTLDEGAEGLRIGAYHAMKHGQWPVVEAGHGYGPLLYLIDYLLIDFFGGTLFASRIMYLFINFSAFVFLYFFLCQMVSSLRMRFFGSLLLICFTSLRYIVTNPSLMFGTVNLSRIAVSFLALLLFIKWIKEESAWFLFFSGIFSAFAFFYSVEYGLAILAVCTLYLLYSFLRRPFHALADISVYFLGSCIMASLIFIPYFLRGFMPQELLCKMLDFMLGEGAASVSKSSFQLIPFDLREATQSLPAFVSYLFSWKFQIFIPFILYPLTFYWIGRLSRRTIINSPKARELVMICSFGAVCYLIPYLSRGGIYYLYGVTPPLIVLMLFLWEAVEKNKILSRLRLKILGLLILFWLTTTQFGLFHLVMDWVGARTYSLACFRPALLRMDHPKAGGIYIHKEQAKFYDELIRAIQKRTEPKEKILIITSPGLFLFLSDRLNATRFFFIRDPAVRKQQEKEIVADLIKNKTLHVIEFVRIDLYTELNCLLDEEYKKEILIPGVFLYTRLSSDGEVAVDSLRR